MTISCQKIDTSFCEVLKTQKEIMASVEVFKSAVLRIRDILRGPGMSITGMDSMRHICLYLLSRYMTRIKVCSLGVPEEFAWENLLETAQTKNGGLQKALDYFYHKEEDSLVNHFDRLFGTEKFSFDVKNPQKHKEILEILNGVKMEDVDCQMDILGWVYEQHLKTGSSAARDLGQFFTDRFICSYMVKLCSPKFKSAGVPESVCDPSMGTGGFLTAYIKYFKDAYPEKPIDWAVQQKEIHGCDTDPKVAGVSRLNLFMESGGRRFENLLTHDSLYGDLPLTGYDVILANMPFGLKGIVHASCCERVKNLKIRGTKSEPLFLQLIMLSLKRSGRCAVVVPDGMLVNTSTLHNGTRKYLLDNFNLKRVIKMKGQFFMNTAIQPTILFFENTGKATEVVEFWDVVADVKGSITESMLLSVPRTKFDASYSFDLRRYQESDKPLVNPAGFKTQKLSEACTISKGKRCLVAVESGGYPYQDVAQISRMVEKYILDTPAVLTPRAMSIGRFVYSEEKCHPSDDMFILKPNEGLNAKYLYYYCMLNLSNKFKESLHGVKPTIDYSVFDYTHIVIPPLEIQNQIVATLDRIYAPGTIELSYTIKMTDRAMDLVLANPGGATLEPIVEAQRLIHKSAQMVSDVKAQMVAVVKASMSGNGCKKYTLSELANDNPESLTKADKLETINYIDLGSVKEGNISLVQLISYEEKPSRAQRKVKNGDIIWGGVRPLSKSYAFIDCATSNTIVSSGFVVVRNKDTTKVLSKYLYFLLTTDDCVNYLNNHSTGTSYPAFNATTLMSYEVSIPSIEVQTKTLSYLNDLQTHLTSLESLQKQSERNAKFILDSYLNPV